MGQMHTLRMAPLILAGAVVTAGCVPDPANRATTDASVASATPTPVPTPAGPTPTPSFIRPTPTPQPTFLIHTVVSGDSLEKIAKRYGTTALSIAYWNRVTYATLDPDSEGYDPDYLAVGWTLQVIPKVEVDPENLPPGRATPEPVVSAEPSPEGG